MCTRHMSSVYYSIHRKIVKLENSKDRYFDAFRFLLKKMYVTTCNTCLCLVNVWELNA